MALSLSSPPRAFRFFAMTSSTVSAAASCGKRTTSASADSNLRIRASFGREAYPGPSYAAVGKNLPGRIGRAREMAVALGSPAGCGRAAGPFAGLRGGAPDRLRRRVHVPALCAQPLAGTRDLVESGATGLWRHLAPPSVGGDGGRAARVGFGRRRAFGGRCDDGAGDA